MFNACICARFQASPQESHFKNVKRTLRFLNETSNHVLLFPKGSEHNLIGLSDFDFARCKSDRKSIIVLVTYLDFFFLSWHSKKQQYNVEAEYVAAGNCYAQVPMISNLVVFQLSVITLV